MKVSGKALAAGESATVVAAPYPRLAPRRLQEQFIHQALPSNDNRQSRKAFSQALCVNSLPNSGCRKKGQEPIAGTARRVLRTIGT